MTDPLTPPPLRHRSRIKAPTSEALVQLAWLLGRWGFEMKAIEPRAITVDGAWGDITDLRELGCTVEVVEIDGDG